MDRIFQVFVSSTFTDLEEERRLVSNSLAKAGFLVAGMELFPATDQDQFEYIKRIIDRSDYYVVITAGRYGSVASDGVGYTEKEFDYAKSRGIPVLAFPHENIGSLAADKSEKEEKGRSSLAAFNEKLKAGRMVAFWKNKDELSMQVVIAVTHAITLTPGLGWVRGDNAIDPKILQEAERLRIENAELKERLSKLSGHLAIEFDPSIAGPDTQIDIVLTERVSNGPIEGYDTEEYVVTTTFGQIFVKTYDDIIKEPTEPAMRDIIGMRFRRPPTKDNTTNVCSNNDVQKVRIQLEALGLIELGSRPVGSTPFVRSVLTWIVTDRGRKYAAAQKALRPSSGN